MSTTANTKTNESEIMISIDSMHKWFDDFHVLKNINLEVLRGEKIVICGPSGSGKSTLIRCINRLEEHQQGTIIVDGTELTSDLKNIEIVRSEVGMVFQPKRSALSLLSDCLQFFQPRRLAFRFQQS